MNVNRGAKVLLKNARKMFDAQANAWAVTTAVGGEHIDDFGNLADAYDWHASV